MQTPFRGCTDMLKGCEEGWHLYNMLPVILPTRCKQLSVFADHQWCQCTMPRVLTMPCAVQLNSTTMQPPAVSSPEFNADFAFTLAFGQINSTNRTAYETDTAKFWYDEDTGKAPCQHLHIAAVANCSSGRQGPHWAAYDESTAVGYS